MTYAAHILNHLSAAVESITPLSLADSSWDNVGLLVEAPFPRARLPGKSARIVCCIDRDSPHFLSQIHTEPSLGAQSQPR